MSIKTSAILEFSQYSIEITPHEYVLLFKLEDGSYWDEATFVRGCTTFDAVRNYANKLVGVIATGARA